MLPARNRMRRSAEYRVAVRTGRRVGRASLVLHLAATGTSAEPARVGFVVSRAVGVAATRNLVKRRLREAVRARIDDLPAGSLLVVRANPASAATSWPGLRSDLDAALERALTRVGARSARPEVDAASRGDG
jgi:ribonuclease P protein component